MTWKTTLTNEYTIEDAVTANYNRIKAAVENAVVLILTKCLDSVFTNDDGYHTTIVDKYLYDQISSSSFRETVAREYAADFNACISTESDNEGEIIVELNFSSECKNYFQWKESIERLFVTSFCQYFLNDIAKKLVDKEYLIYKINDTDKRTERWIDLFTTLDIDLGDRIVDEFAKYDIDLALTDEFLVFAITDNIPNEYLTY